ncbi:MAG: hypothetical protein ACP5TK_01700 [Candidatus Micrarchaeia archaeon]
MDRPYLYLPLIAFALLSIVNVASAQQSYANSITYCLGQVTSAYSSLTISPVLGIAVIALIVSIAVVAIGFIISKLVPTTGIGSWLRNEYWEIGKSAMLIASIYAVIIIVGNIATTIGGISVSGTGYGSYVGALGNAATNYLYNLYCGSSGVTGIGQEANYLTQFAYGLGVLKGLIVGFYLPLPTPWVGFTFGAEFQPYVNSMFESGPTVAKYQSIVNDFINFLVVPMSIVISVQYITMHDIILLGLLILLPIGIVLRAFPFLRGIGGTLIAMSIAISILYPAVLVLLNQPIVDTIGQLNSAQTNISNNGPWWMSLVLSIVTTFDAVGAAFGSFGTIYPGLNFITAFSLMMLLQFFLFIFDVIIVYALADTIAKALGGTLRLQIGGKIKIG